MNAGSDFDGHVQTIKAWRVDALAAHAPWLQAVLLQACVAIAPGPARVLVPPSPAPR